jgi:hypothetical protein
MSVLAISNRSPSRSVRRIDLEEVVLAEEHVVDPVPSSADEQRRSHAVAGRHAAEHEGFFDVIRVAAPDGVSRCLLRCVVEHPAHLLCGQPGDTGSRSRRSEVARERMGTSAAFISEDRAAERHRQPAPDVVAQRHCTQVMLAARAPILAHRECRRHDRRSRMRLRRTVRVVGLVRVGENTVDQRRIDWPGQDRGARHRRDRPTGLLARQRQCGAAGRQFRPRDHRCQCVEDVVLGLFDCISGEEPILRAGHVGAQRGGHGMDALGAKPSRREGSSA